MPEGSKKWEDDCDFCRSITKDSDDYDKCRQLLHSNCARCSLPEHEYDPPLCATCSHLRLPHLFICSDPHDLPALDYKVPCLDLLSRDSSCRFCRLLINAAHAVQDAMRFDISEWRGKAAHLQILEHELLIQFPDLPGRDAVVGFDLWRRVSDSKGRYFTSIENSVEQKHSDLPPLDEPVNWEKVSAWVNQDYDATIGSAVQTPRNMKVIDVNQDRVIDAPFGCRYLALSYVFGNVKTIELSPSGCFDRHQLPATIRDAIIACEKIGIDFLWVDQLCINQEDEKQLQEQINQMNRIYQSATCTLVAFAGENSLHGLPGVSKPRNLDHNTIQIDDELVVRLKPPRYLYFRHCKWLSRGWTFQEAVFSSRLVLFAEFSVFYVDQDRVHSEDIYYPDYTIPRLSAKDYYFNMIQEYAKRDLSFPSDGVRAFTAVLQEFHGDNTHHGLPLDHIDKAILWAPDSYGPSRKNTSEFPSWSWASHCGRIYHRQLCASLAIWAKPEASGSASVCKPDMKRIWDDGWPYLKERMVVIAAAWSAGCIRSLSPAHGRFTHPDISGLVERWPTYGSYWEEVFGSQINKTLFCLDDLNITSSLDRLILVHCQTAHFSVHHPTGKAILSHGKDILHVRSSNGSLSGIIEIPKYLPRSSVAWKGELLLLSSAATIDRDFEDAWYTENEDTDVDDLIHRDERGEPWLFLHESWKLWNVIVLNVMLIERRENCDLACRVGVGQIFLKRWVEANPQFRTVVLE